MAILPCYECGAAISTTAVSCPNCGAPNKMKVAPLLVKAKPETRPIFKLIGFALTAFFAFILFSSNKTPTEPIVPEGPALSVDAENLAAAYNDNEVAADNNYKGKRLIVAGVVESINKDFKNAVWVGLRTHNHFMPIHAQGFTPGEVTGLKKGEVVAIICIGAGMVVGSPFLDNCRLPNNVKG